MPGWLSWLSVSLQLRSRCHDLRVQAPLSGPMLTAQNLDPDSDSVSPSLCFSPLMFCLSLPIKNKHFRGTWVAQSVKQPTSAQVIIPWFVTLSPSPDSVLTARSLESASDSVPSSLPLPLLHLHSVSLSLSLSHTHK